MSLKKANILPFIFLLSCQLEGVKNDSLTDIDTADNNISFIDSTTPEPKNIKTLILPDTVNGKPNNMVYQDKSGLRIEWTEKNNDPIRINDVVMVNYNARVAGGKEYDNNEKIGAPIPLKSNIGMMVPGWEEGLKKMNIGDKGRIMIPSALGYGKNGNSKFVPPNADLIVDIEIVERVESITLKEGVRIFTWFKSNSTKTPKKRQKITFEYFAYTVGNEGGMYDNSYKNGKPFIMSFKNDNVVDGLHQGMGELSAGDKAFIEIPSALAYGKIGLIGLVPENTNIVYDVRIISIE